MLTKPLTAKQKAKVEVELKQILRVMYPDWNGPVTWDPITYLPDVGYGMMNKVSKKVVEKHTALMERVKNGII